MQGVQGVQGVRGVQGVQGVQGVRAPGPGRLAPPPRPGRTASQNGVRTVRYTWQATPTIVG